MSPSTAKKNATEFLRDQAEIIKKYDGKAPKLTGEDYRAALHDTAKTFQSLSSARKVRRDR
jgi:hypothetical protein